MKRIANLTVVSLVLCVMAQCQTFGHYNKHVAVVGNSIAHFQAPFGLREFPAVSNVYIWGQDGQTCDTIERTIIYLVPANSDVVVLIDSTNDIRTSVPVEQHMTCIEATIATLLARNPSLKVVVANTPPWTHQNPCDGSWRLDSVRDLIEAYNAAYADPNTGLQAMWPNNVRVADVFSPNADSDGWAVPADMVGPCGVHPDQAFVWSPVWAHFAAGYESLVMQAVSGQW